MREIVIDGLDEIEIAYRLRFRLGLSYREIADCTGASEGTVMSRLARGRRRHGVRADYRHRSLRRP